MVHRADVGFLTPFFTALTDVKTEKLPRACRERNPALSCLPTRHHARLSLSIYIVWFPVAVFASSLARGPSG